VESIKEPFNIALDKELTLQILEINRIPAIRLADVKTCSFPIVGRMHGHHRGRDICIVESEEKAREEGFDYFTKLYVIEKEYYVEVEGLCIKKVMEAVPSKVMWSEVPIRTDAFGWRWKETDSMPEEWMQIAIRSLYVTGLTNGYVKMGKLMDESPIVIDINLPSDIISFMPVASPAFFTMGMDVEFMLRHKDDLVPASYFFSLEGEVGCDERQIEQDSGVYALAEIRPKPAESPYELFFNMKRLLIEASEKVPYHDIEFLAGSMPFSGYQCGGHIHFGIPLSLPLLRALDSYVAVPVSMIEDSRTAKRRRKTKHGGLGRYRVKPYGFEYLSLSSWISEPDMALAILCLAKLVAAHHHELPDDFLFDPLVQRAYYSGNRLYLKRFWSTIKQRLISTSSYFEYRKELDTLFKRIEEEKLLKDSGDIRKEWGLETLKQSYDSGMSILISKKLRNRFNVEVGQTSYIRAGKLIALADIRPYPFSFRSPNAVQLSEHLREALSIPLAWQPKLFLQNGILSLGPVIGILSNATFESQATYFRQLCRLGAEKQMLVYIFDPRNIDWDKMVVEGTSHIGSGIFPLPDVIYDRYFIDEDNVIEEIDEIRIKLQSVYGIPFINPLSLFKLTGDKSKCYEVLSQTCAEYLPDTRLLENPYDAIEMLDQYGEIFLKPLRGALGSGIVQVTRHLSGVLWFSSNEQQTKCLTTMDELTDQLFSLKCKNDYLVQEGILRKQIYDSYVEIRVYMQKNSQQKWLRTGMVARLSKKGIITRDTEVNMRISKVLTGLYPDPNKRKEIREKIAQVARSVVEVIEESAGSAGELAVDLCIDAYDNIKVIEINSKPDNLFLAANVKAFRIRNLASNRLLNYAAALAGYNSEPTL
jgi:hypothetical protein